jgi:hypothetical protein
VISWLEWGVIHGVDMNTRLSRLASQLSKTMGEELLLVCSEVLLVAEDDKATVGD